MQIYDAAGVACALHDLVTHNRLAGQLAEAWDKQHPDDMPIVKACEKLRDDWDKTVWLSRVRGLIGIALLFVIISSSTLAVAAQYWTGTFLLPVIIGICGVLLFVLGLKLAGWIQKTINAYCQAGNQLWQANRAIREVYDKYKDLGDVSDVLKFLDTLCFEIMKREMLDMEESKIVLPIGSNDILIAENLDELRDRHRCEVKNIGSFGLVSTNLTFHYLKADVRLSQMIESGEILTDFQI